jgi:hypothetical protein
MSDNLKLWQSVEKTDPKYTKAFSKAGGFSGTAINATYLIRKATELWGPMGGTWGPEVVDDRYVAGGDGVIIHVLRINLRHPHGSVPSYGQTTFVGKNKNGVFTDEEAPKKSLTDATTKALSMLGFSADVFLGLYDDNKYVNDRKQEFSKHKSVAAEKWDEMAPEQREFLEGIARKVKDVLGKEGGIVAMKVLEEETITLLTEEKVALWNLFDSKERSAMEPHKRVKKAA